MHPSVCPSISPSVIQSVYSFTSCLFILLSIRPSFHSSPTPLLVHSSNHGSVIVCHSFVCLSLHKSIRLLSVHRFFLLFFPVPSASPFIHCLSLPQSDCRSVHPDLISIRPSSISPRLLLLHSLHPSLPSICMPMGLYPLIPLSLQSVCSKYPSATISPHYD